MTRLAQVLLAGIVAVVTLAAGSPARAECIVLPIDVRRSFRDAAMVFAGTIVQGNDERLTFRPDRVWKGRPEQQVTIHLVGRPGIDRYRFRVGERHLVLAHVVTDKDDPDDLPVGVLAMGRGCGSPPWPLTLTPELDRLARPRAVRR